VEERRQVGRPALDERCQCRLALVRRGGAPLHGLAQVHERLWIAEDQGEGDRVLAGRAVLAAHQLGVDRRPALRHLLALAAAQPVARTLQQIGPRLLARRGQRGHEDCEIALVFLRERIIDDPPGDEPPHQGDAGPRRQAGSARRVGRHERLDRIPEQERQVGIVGVLLVAGEPLGDGPALIEREPLQGAGKVQPHHRRRVTSRQLAELCQRLTFNLRPLAQ
jgi:hypothetical protein